MRAVRSLPFAVLALACAFLPSVASAQTAPPTDTALQGFGSPTTMTLQQLLASQPGAQPRASDGSMLEHGVAESAPGGLEVTIQQIHDVRAAGSGFATVDLAELSDPGVPARDLRMRINVAEGIRVLSARGAGWTCVVQGSTADCRNAHVSHTTGGGHPISLQLAGPPNLTNGTARMTASLTWRERKDARVVAAGYALPAPRGSPEAKLITRSDNTSVDIKTDAPLRVTLNRLGPLEQLSDGQSDGDFVLFAGTIRNLDSSVITARWRQVCLTAAEAANDPDCGGRIAPAATLVDPEVSKGAHIRETMSISLPPVQSRQRLVFELIAEGEGASAAARAEVVAVPFRPAVLNANVDGLAEALAIAPPNEGAPVVGFSAPLIRGGIDGAGATNVRPGGTAVLTVHVPGREIKAIAWGIKNGPTSLLAGAGRDGVTLRLPIPRSLSGTILIVTARVTLAGGDTVEFSELVDVAAPDGLAPAASARLLRGAATVRTRNAAAQSRVAMLQRPYLAAARSAQSTRANETAQQVQALCSLHGIVSRKTQQKIPYSVNADTSVNGQTLPDVVFGGTSTFWFGPNATVSATACGSDTRIEIVDGELAMGEIGFARIKGWIDITGLHITGGAFRPPREWTKIAPGLKQSIENATAFTIPKGIEVGARLTPRGQWRDVGGEIEIPTGIELLPLPGGWKFLPARLRLEASGLVALTIEAKAPTGNGSAILRGSISPLGELEIYAAVSGIGVFTQSDGTQVELSGAGTLTFSWVDNPEAATDDEALQLAVDPQITVGASNILIAENLRIETISLSWTPGEISALGRIRVGNANNGMVLELSGIYGGAQNWNFNLAAKGTWNVTDSLNISDLGGTIKRDATGTTFRAAGSAKGWKPSPQFTISELTAAATNECDPTEAEKGDCKPGSVRLDLTAKGSVALVDGSQATDITAYTTFNLGTGRFTLSADVAVKDGTIGPKELKLRNVKVQLTNEGDRGSVCSFNGEKPQNGDLRLSIIADGEVLGEPASFTGQFGQTSGVCFVGRVGKMNPALPMSANFSGAYAFYASRDATIPLGDGLQLPAKAGEFGIAADFAIPDAWTKIGLAGRGRFVGQVGSDLKSVKATIQVGFSSNPILFGTATTSNLTMDGITLGYSSAEKALTAGAMMTYNTPAAADGSVQASATPLDVTMTVGPTGFTLSGGVDIRRAKGGVVENAFGTQGLTVRQLKFGASIGTQTAITFDANVSLPAAWGSRIGLVKEAQVILAASISQTNPCFQFEISRTDAATNPRGFAVDLANKGLLAARTMKLVIAPAGCTVGGGLDARLIQPGFGLVFDGLIGGQFELRVGIQVRLPTPQKPNDFYVDAELKAPKLSLGGVVSLDETNFRLLIDVPGNKYALTMQAGLDVLGSTARINANFEASGLGNIKLDATSNVDIRIVGLTLNSDLAIKLDVKNGQIGTFVIDADVRFRVLGVTIAGAKAGFEYDKGVVSRFEFAVSAGINIGIGSATGTVGVKYQLLKTNTAKPEQYTEKTFKVNFAGSARILFVRKSFNWDIVNYRGAYADNRTVDNQDVNWSDTDQQVVPKEPALPWISWQYQVRDTGTSMQDAKVLSIGYATDYKVKSTNGDAPTATAAGRLVIQACPLGSFQGNDACNAPLTFTGLIDFDHRKISIVDGQQVAQAGGGTVTGNATLEGVNWDAAVQYIEKARQEFKKANAAAGLTLPPLKVWTQDRPAVAIGEVRYTPGGDLTWVVNATLGADTAGQQVFEFGRSFGQWNGGPSRTTLLPGRAIPLTGDWNGDGRDEAAAWYAPDPTARDGMSGFQLRNTDGSSTDVPVGGLCFGNGFCQPIEPPGTYWYNQVPESRQESGAAATFPVTGDWDGEGTKGITTDDFGAARVSGSAIFWTIRSEGKPEYQFFFGKNSRDGWMDRPITGDWDGDGRTDFGIYRPPTKPGDIGEFRLITAVSASVERYQGAAGWNLDGKETSIIKLGAYGDEPITGDWNNDGADGIGVVSTGSPTEAPTWRLRDIADISCETACLPDLTFPFGTYGSTPIAGRFQR